MKFCTSPQYDSVIFDLVYDIESIVNTPYYYKEVAMKSYLIMVYIASDLHGMYLN